MVDRRRGALIVVLLVVVSMTRAAKGKLVPVQFAKLRIEDVTSQVRAPGKIEPRTQVKVSADIMGKITQLAVKEGDRVKKGQLMLQLDDTQYRSNYQAAARAALSSAQARQREASR